MRFFTVMLLMGLGVNLAAAAASAGKETHPFSVHDMLAMDRISDPQISPDGQNVVFTLRKTDLKANRGRTDLWIVEADGQNLRRLTSHPAGDFNPRWSSCGKYILFLSTRSGSSQVWSIRVDGGEAVQLTDLPLDVGNLVVSPYGEYIAFTTEVFVNKCMKGTRKQLDETAADPMTGRIYDSIFIRHWDTWKDGRRSHLFVMSLKDKNPVDVMKAMDADTPSKPFGGPEEIAFAPGNSGIVFTTRNVGREEAWSTNFDLFLASLDGRGEPVCLTGENEAWDTSPVFSPDGKTMAYLAMAVPRYESDRFRIVLRTGKNWEQKRVLTESWDFSPGSIAFSADGKEIYATAANKGQRSLFALDMRTGKDRVLVRDGYVASLAGAAGTRIIFGMDHLQSPVELYSIHSDGRQLKPITRINADKLESVRMGYAEQFSFAGWNDETVYCYIVKPVDFDPSKKYPVAFLIHGGPQGSFGNHFHYRWNPQAYAGAGYAAVMVDFHGSVGYGQAFCDAIRGDWGGKPLEDLVKGLDAALKRYPWMDGERVGALGASFGGWMINWIAGQLPERFKCLVSHDGNLDERMAYFNTEELWFPEWDHMGTPWTNPEGYEKHNPVNHVGKWKTPMLVIHGALDYRVVDTQGIGTFNALQRRGIPSRLLYFHDENHWVLKPHNSIQWHDTVIGWLDQWCK
ncbi:MAG TPA: S9 family peptidase [bacterium]|nr:S9 family peptidase [bacterium]